MRMGQHRSGGPPLKLPDPSGDAYGGSVIGYGAQAEHAWGCHASRAVEQGTYGSSHVQVSCPGQGTCKREARRGRWARGMGFAGRAAPSLDTAKGWSPHPHPWDQVHGRCLANHHSECSAEPWVPISCMTWGLPRFPSCTGELPRSPTYAVVVGV